MSEISADIDSSKMSVNLGPDDCEEETPHDRGTTDAVIEMKCLREMSLVNLDLIQRQYELIQNKEKQIKTLKSEKDALKCRLERMERRMSLLRQHQDVQEKVPSHISPTVTQQQAQSHEKAKKAEVPPAVQTTNKRKSMFEPQNLSKKFASDVKRERHNSTESTQSTRSTRQARAASEVAKNNRSKQSANAKQGAKASQVQDEGSITPQSRPSRIRHLSPEEKNTNCNARTGQGAKNVNDVLRTNRSYYSSNQEYQKPELRSKKYNKEKVEVPTWKIVTYTNCYTLEGTENLEDEIFLKRHQKPEKEEIRRKRWDMQRLREQRMFEKLQQGRYASKLKKQIKVEDREPETFAPKLDDAQYIEVCEQIPVTAFGYPIPSIDDSEFRLPWCEKANKVDRAKTTPRKR